MPNPAFTGKTALVTGASSGIGRAVALALAKDGASVMANYNRNRNAAESLRDEIRAAGGTAHTIQADVSNAGAVQHMLDRTLETFNGQLDILVNNAGEWMDKAPIAECPEELWDRMMNVNLKSVFLCCRAAIPTMQKQKNGSIINITSVAGHSGGGGGTVPYGAAKAGVNTFTKGLAKELAPDGIRVNAVAPGVIDTPMQHKHSTPEQLDRFSGAVPLKRLGKAEEIVGAVLLLASDQGSYITGEIIDVNGGLLMR
ncbi:MAG: 3-oxoacyl-ACP reductase FabG [bacterium]|nr:3-oxoacyl-ACP reductase FabG [bacterium]